MKRVMAVLLLAVTANATACGVCLDDKIAATYDYAVVTHAAEHHQWVVFGEIDGPVNVADVTQRIRKFAPRIHGVLNYTVRVSISPPAFAFAVDPRVTDVERVVARLREAIGGKAVRLEILRVIDGPL